MLIIFDTVSLSEALKRDKIVYRKIMSVDSKENNHFIIEYVEKIATRIRLCS